MKSHKIKRFNTVKVTLPNLEYVNESSKPHNRGPKATKNKMALVFKHKKGGTHFKRKQTFSSSRAHDQGSGSLSPAIMHTQKTPKTITPQTKALRSYSKSNVHKFMNELMEFELQSKVEESMRRKKEKRFEKLIKHKSADIQFLRRDSIKASNFRHSEANELDKGLAATSFEDGEIEGLLGALERKTKKKRFTVLQDRRYRSLKKEEIKEMKVKQMGTQQGARSSRKRFWKNRAIFSPSIRTSVCSSHKNLRLETKQSRNFVSRSFKTNISTPKHHLKNSTRETEYQLFSSQIEPARQIYLNNASHNPQNHDNSLTSRQKGYITIKTEPNLKRRKSESRVDSYLRRLIPSMHSTKTMLKIESDFKKKIKNYRNLKEEINGNIYSQKRFDELYNDKGDIENLEKWHHENTEILRVNLMKQMDEKHNSSTLNSHLGGVYEQKLRIPELNLDVLNLGNKKERSRIKATKTRLYVQRSLEGAAKDPEGSKEALGKVLIDDDDKEDTEQITITQKGFAESIKLHKYDYKMHLIEHHGNFKSSRQGFEDKSSLEYNIDLVSRAIVNKLEKEASHELRISAKDRSKVAGQIERMAKDIIIQFKALGSLAKSKQFSFSFDKFLEDFERNRMKKEHRSQVTVQDLWKKNQERQMIEKMEKEELYYLKYNKLIVEMKNKHYDEQRLLKDNIKRTDFVKKMELQVKFFKTKKSDKIKFFKISQISSFLL